MHSLVVAYYQLILKASTAFASCCVVLCLHNGDTCVRSCLCSFHIIPILQVYLKCKSWITQQMFIFFFALAESCKIAVLVGCWFYHFGHLRLLLWTRAVALRVPNRAFTVDVQLKSIMFIMISLLGFFCALCFEFYLCFMLFFFIIFSLFYALWFYFHSKSVYFYELHWDEQSFPYPLWLNLVWSCCKNKIVLFISCKWRHALFWVPNSLVFSVFPVWSRQVQVFLTLCTSFTVPVPHCWYCFHGNPSSHGCFLKLLKIMEVSLMIIVAFHKAT